MDGRDSKLQAGKDALLVLQKKRKLKAVNKKKSSTKPSPGVSFDGKSLSSSSSSTEDRTVDVAAQDSLGCDEVSNVVATDVKVTIVCICSSLEERALMLQCDVCDSWLHCDCLSIPAEMAKAPSFPFVCPFCVKDAVPKLKVLAQELSSLKHEFESFKTWALSILPEAGVAGAVSLQEEVARQPESQVQYPSPFVSDSTLADCNDVINPPLPMSPLLSPFVLCLWGTQKAATSNVVRNALIEAFRGCEGVSFPDGLVCVRRRQFKRNGRKRWYHAILGEKDNLMAMQRCQFLLPDKWSLSVDLPDHPPTSRSKPRSSSRPRSVSSSMASRLRSVSPLPSRPRSAPAPNTVTAQSINSHVSSQCSAVSTKVPRSRRFVRLPDSQVPFPSQPLIPSVPVLRPPPLIPSVPVPSQPLIPSGSVPFSNPFNYFCNPFLFPSQISAYPPQPIPYPPFCHYPPSRRCP